MINTIWQLGLHVKFTENNFKIKLWRAGFSHAVWSVWLMWGAEWADSSGTGMCGMPPNEQCCREGFRTQYIWTFSTTVCQQVVWKEHSYAQFRETKLLSCCTWHNLLLIIFNCSGLSLWLGFKKQICII